MSSVDPTRLVFDATTRTGSSKRKNKMYTIGHYGARSERKSNSVRCSGRMRDNSRGKAYPTQASMATRQCTVSYFRSVSAGMYLHKLRGSKGFPPVSMSYPPIASSEAFACGVRKRQCTTIRIHAGCETHMHEVAARLTARAPSKI